MPATKHRTASSGLRGLTLESLSFPRFVGGPPLSYPTLVSGIFFIYMLSVKRGEKIYYVGYVSLDHVVGRPAFLEVGAQYIR